MTDTTTETAAPAPPVNIAGGVSPYVALSAAARAGAAQRAEILAALAQGLGSLAYGERRAALAHLAPRLGSLGLTPAMAANFDPTDANLAALREEAGQLGTALQDS